MKFHTWIGAVAMIAALSFAGTSNRASAAGLLVADGGLGGRLEIVEQDVRVTINNGIAVTQIDQTFLNKENRIVEALYTFPVPNGASVSNFTMIIGGKEMIGEVVEKKRARQIYDSYKTKRRDPGLLEQVDYKTFELRVFPIAANAEQKISVTYYQRLDFDHNQATYVYPLATTTSGTIDSTTQGRFAFTLDVKSEIPITACMSPSHKDDFVITSPTENYSRASLEVQEGDLSRDVVVNFDTARPRTGIDVITSNPEGEDGYFMLSMTAGKDMEELATGMDYVFVVDISGSMANDSKLAMSRNAVGSFVNALGPDDRYEVITFNTQPNLQFGELRSVDVDAKTSSNEFLMSQRARGGTELRPAISTAYRYQDADRPLNVVVLSDGMTEVSEQGELLAAINEAASGIRVFCIGIGNDTNRPLLKQLAEGAGGLAAFISHQDDFDRQADAFRRKLMRPVATNVQVSIEGVGSYDIANDTTPDLFYGSPIWILGRYKNPGQGTVRVSAEILGQPFEQAIDLEFPKRDDSNPEIERMWAFDRVSGLMDSMRSGGENLQTTNEIVRLCENYSIVSEYASFIVLENDAEYARWSIDRKNANRVRRDRAAQSEIREQLEQLRNNSVAALGPAQQESNTNATAQTQIDPVVTSPAASPARNAATAPSQQPGDFNFQPRSQNGGGGGGGAIDPFTGLAVLSGAGISALAARRRKQKLDRETEV